ncbi:MAG: amino-acid N-acetyltransferase, partial [Gammaproteobacteria bacterium]|nr:amino-acid N-acetyltransferase [Gammaproteobacteria bacterium]
MDSADFARWFRDSTPYISAHRDRTFVVLLGGDALASSSLVNTVHDLALLHVLGVRLVVIHGFTDEPPPGDPEPTDGAAVDAVVGAIGVARSRLEALFSTGVPSSPLRASRITLTSGNLVTAKPAGVIDGIDRLRTGEVRRVHSDEMRQLIDTGAIVLVPPIGYSASGAAYVLAPETLAAEVAAAVGADKLIVYDEIHRVNDVGDMTPQLLAEALAEGGFGPATEARLRALLDANAAGVARCHLISYRTDGALLQELFTAEGVGTQVSKEDYRAIRPATSADVA